MIARRGLSSKRRGLTLLEVLIALGIFLMSFAAIGQMITMSADWALDVQQQTRAAQLCQAKLAEVVAGVVPLSGQTGVPFDEEPKFLWSLDAAQAEIAGLWKVTVRVTLERADGARIECSLDRMLLDPSLRGSALDAAMTAANSSSSGSNPSGSSGSSSGTGASASSGGGASAASGSTAKSATGAGGGSSPAASAPKATTGSSPAPSSSGGKAGSASKGGN